MFIKENIEQLKQLSLKEIEKKIQECDKGFDAFRWQNGKLDNTKFKEIAELQNYLNLLKSIRDEKLTESEQ